MGNIDLSTILPEDLFEETRLVPLGKKVIQESLSAHNNTFYGSQNVTLFLGADENYYVKSGVCPERWFKCKDNGRLKDMLAQYQITFDVDIPVILAKG